VGKTIGRTWDHNLNAVYRDLRQDPIKWEAAEKIIRLEASNILSKVAAKTDPQSVDLVGLLKKDGLERDIKGDLIARWVQIGLEAYDIETDDRVKRLGWTKFETYRHYFQDRGFVMNKLGAVLPKSFLWPEERKWFLEHRPDK
jgi:hypothetical protein